MTRLDERLGRHRGLLTCLLVILWAVALVLTHIPPSEMPSPGISDRVLHVIGYWGLATVLAVTMLSYRLPSSAPVANKSRSVKVTGCVTLSCRRACLVFAMLCSDTSHASTRPIPDRCAAQ